MSLRSTLVLLPLALAGCIAGCTVDRNAAPLEEARERPLAGRRFRIEIIGAW